MSLSGSIEDLPLLEILQVVAFCQKTGHLTVRSPGGDAGVVFRDGRVVSGYIWDVPAATPADQLTPPAVRARIGSILERLVRLREGQFAFNLSDAVPDRLDGRDLSGETLADGINTEELMLDLARKLDEDRRDCAASLQASFTAAEEPCGGDESETSLEELTLDAATEPPHGPLVLLVDDEPDVCRVVGKRLADIGFEIALAAGAAHARREMQRLASGGRPFLLVLDVGLPSLSGSSFRGGLDVVRDASALATPPPVLLMAETIDDRLRARAKRLGVSLIAFKPGLSKLDPLQYEADLRAFADKLAKDLLPRLEGRRRGRPSAPRPVQALRRVPDAEAGETALRAALAEIEADPTSDIVAFALLRAARAFFPRVILFVVKDDGLRGISGFGPIAGDGSLDSRSREIMVPLHEPSPFSEAIVTGRAWTGPVPNEGPMRALADAIGLGVLTAAVLPVRATRETIAVLYADAPSGTTLPSIEPFAAFVDRAGRALDGALAARRTVLGAA